MLMFFHLKPVFFYFQSYLWCSSHSPNIHSPNIQKLFCQTGKTLFRFLNLRMTTFDLFVGVIVLFLVGLIVLCLQALFCCFRSCLWCSSHSRNTRSALWRAFHRFLPCWPRSWISNVCSFVLCIHYVWIYVNSYMIYMGVYTYACVFHGFIFSCCAVSPVG